MTRAGAACLRGDFEAARAIQARYLPLMNINFVESNPIPVKAAMGLMGLLEPVYRLPMVPAQPGQPGQDREGAGGVGLAGEGVGCRLKSSIFSTRSPASYEAGHFRLFAEFKTALERRARTRRRARRLPRHRLARQRLGKEGHPAGLPHGRCHRYVGRSRTPALLR